MTQPFVIYTAGLCPWERQDGTVVSTGSGDSLPACVHTPALPPLTTYGNLGKLLHFFVLIWKIELKLLLWFW